MIAVPIDNRCRCIHPNHRGMCPNKATHVTWGGVVLCEHCVEEHHYGAKPREIAEKK